MATRGKYQEKIGIGAGKGIIIRTVTRDVEKKGRVGVRENIKTIGR